MRSDRGREGSTYVFVISSPARMGRRAYIDAVSVGRFHFRAALGPQLRSSG